MFGAPVAAIVLGAGDTVDVVVVVDAPRDEEACVDESVADAIIPISASSPCTRKNGCNNACAAVNRATGLNTSSLVMRSNANGGAVPSKTLLSPMGLETFGKLYRSRFASCMPSGHVSSVGVPKVETILNI